MKNMTWVQSTCSTVQLVSAILISLIPQFSDYPSYTPSPFVALECMIFCGNGAYYHHCCRYFYLLNQPFCYRWLYSPDKDSTRMPWSKLIKKYFCFNSVLHHKIFVCRRLTGYCKHVYRVIEYLMLRSWLLGIEDQGIIPVPCPQVTL